MKIAIEENLVKGINLLNILTDEQYCNNSIAPYFSSIGCHFRHILDVFSCVLNGYETKKIDLTSRNRNELIEQNKELCLEYFQQIIFQLSTISESDLSTEIEVIDDLGAGKISAKTSLAAVLIQAHSHAIHHYASVGSLIYHLGLELPDSHFGFNPTTPKKK